MRIFKLVYTAVALSVLVFAFMGGNPSDAVAASKTFFGEPRNLGQGTVRSLVKVDEQGTPVTLGVSLTKAALSGLPSGEFPTEVTLTLPEEVAVAPFDHISVDWNPHGHEPLGIYDVPHFDIHFYMISDVERDKIGPNDTEQFAKAPGEGSLPVNYQPTPGGVPRMGAHWVDVTSPEFHGKPFTATFIYGTYDGSVNFYEPMVAQAFLEATQDFTAEIKQPSVFQKKGYYPQKYRIAYHEETEEYTIIIDELTYH